MGGLDSLRAQVDAPSRELTDFVCACYRTVIRYAARAMRLPFLRAKPATYSTPPNTRIYAIGDVHGRSDLLDQLLALIEDDDSARVPAERHLVFLGDLVDRGPDSRKAVSRALELLRERPNVRLLMGNHEEIMLAAAEGDTDALRAWLRVGGRATLESYGLPGDVIDTATATELVDLLRAHVPESHIAGIRGLESMVRLGDYIFVHAGIRPRIRLDAQASRDLRWIREPFLSHRGPHGFMVVHGHTVTSEVDENDNRIGIDTGAYVSGRLTAIGIEDDRRWFLSTEPA